MPYQVFELTFQHGRTYADPTWDVTIAVTCTSPTGKKATVGGFFYGSSKPQKVAVEPNAGIRGAPRAVWSCSTGYWYRPTDGAMVARFEAEAGRRTITAPPFSVDLALIVTNGDLPDTDGDGTANHRDTDDDNDGVPDAQDAWPLEREEWADADADRIGDNLDADVDSDGKADDRNHNGVADCDEQDGDGDGVPNAGSIPWDAFPRDPQEWCDTDGDGVGDNADTDDDGDGHTDADEREAGTDPQNPLSGP